MPDWRLAIVRNRIANAPTKYQKAINPGMFSTKDILPTLLETILDPQTRLNPPVEAGLLAKAVGQLAMKLDTQT